MNNYTDRQIEEQLKQLQSIRPGAESLERMNTRIRNLIADADQTSKSYSLWSYAVASAAVLLIGISLLYTTKPVETGPFGRYPASTESAFTLAKLNAVFNNGGQQALNDYFEEEQQRQPRAESVTLQEMLKEL